MAKYDELLTKYNLEAISLCIKEKLGNLAQTLKDSNLDQVRTLVCQINPTGLLWNGNAYLHTKNSPFFRAIMDLQGSSISFGGEGGI